MSADATGIMKMLPRRFLLLWALLAVLLVANNARYLFRAELHEHSDYVVVSLAVREAHTFSRLYGPFSRWRFYHPGPAYFYIYAAGEALLYDTLHLVPTPFNAQLIATTILMTFFTALALAIAERHVRAPLFVPLALLVCLLYLSPVGASLWQDNFPLFVLVMPFLAFVVACASVTSGNGSALAAATLCGGFLLQGHVSLILFVVPFYGLAVWGLRANTGSWRDVVNNNRLTLGISAVLALLFVLPLAVDATRGPQSNLHALMAYMAVRHPPKSIADSLFYLAHFLDPAHIHPHTAMRLDYSSNEVVRFFDDRPRAFVLLTTILCTVCAGLWRQPKRDPQLQRFLVCLIGYALLAVVVTVVWGVLHYGEMYYYDSWLNFAIFTSLLIATAALISDHLRKLPPPWTAIAACAALAVFWLNAGYFRAVILDNDESRRTYRNVLAASAAVGQGPVYIAFDSRQQGWTTATAMVLQLERRGVLCYLSDYEDSRVYSFAPSRMLNCKDARLTSGDLPIWHVAPAGLSPGAQDLPLMLGMGLYTRPVPLHPDGGAVVFDEGGNSALYTVGGWSVPVAYGRASVTAVVMLDFRALPAERDVEMAIVAFPFLTDQQRSQTMELSLDGQALGSFELHQKGTVRATIPAAVWNNRTNGRMVMSFPNAVPNDQNRLGWGFSRIDFQLK